MTVNFEQIFSDLANQHSVSITALAKTGIYG